ncbi:MAG: isoleucine--tRNA ligase [Flavobacteriales bacterium]|nr:MAG: isoleucine--tRNA ligase [Flavobacteriales bacterium]
MSLYPEYKKGLDLPSIQEEVRTKWKLNNVFKQSIIQRENKPTFTFYEGPPSANGMPGIHHVMARTVKDVFCRFKTQQGFQVNRKAGWDTHGLPVELSVEKTLGITKEDIGTKITVEEYNAACRKEVMKYTDVWNQLTDKMGYWVDMDDPYITYENKYIESVWHLLKELYDKKLIYKGYTIQPYSPAAGTGLSSHELNQPGCYKDVKDSSMVAMFEAENPRDIYSIFSIDYQENIPVFFLAWTTTPWTLPSNTALTVGEGIEYVLVDTYNQYTYKRIRVIMAKALLAKNLDKKYREESSFEALESFEEKQKTIPYLVAGSCMGADLLELKYQQLLAYTQPMENPELGFRIIKGDFVTTEDGTGIVHTAPTFGADDAKVAKEAGVPPMLIEDAHGNPVPLVNLQGRFVNEMRDEVFGFAGEPVKAEYLSDEEKQIELDKQRTRLAHIIPKLDQYLSVDERIGLKLKLENRAFKIEKYEHNYPHCWRTDKPVLYYPLDSWFIAVTKMKNELVAKNNEINWKPASTGTGRFGNWLENANDWNLSRSRFWGIPLPIWRTDDGLEAKCIGSVEELKNEVDKSVKLGFMEENPLLNFVPGNFSKENYEQFDLHKPYVDKLILVSESGAPMKREADLIDVWFDSGSMPFAQWHYPFENQDIFDKNFPADFIAEGVDQTRGWFYTLHAISVMTKSSVAYKNVVSNGLVLDKNGQKMSKRLGNAIDPFTTLDTYGSDAVRWYMMSNAQPWDNLRFDLEGITEVQRKFFGTLFNTYSFFTLYANVDGFCFQEKHIPVNQRPEMDRWILSELHSLIREVGTQFSDYEPTRATRAIMYFVSENLSNWYVRLCRRRFWKGEYAEDKISAYQTLYECLLTLSKLMAPVAPFYADRLYSDLNSLSNLEPHDSVHLADWPEYDESLINAELEEQTHVAQQLSSMILSLRKKEKIKVRQPLQKVLVPALSDELANRIDKVRDIILAETNVKELEILRDVTGTITKKIKPNFKVLGGILGSKMKVFMKAVQELTQENIQEFEKQGFYDFNLEGDSVRIDLEHVEVQTDDIPGWLVVVENGYTVALDATISPDLRREGIARELINRVQNMRKESDFELTDRIVLSLQSDPQLQEAVETFYDYICLEVLATGIQWVDQMDSEVVEFDGVQTRIQIERNA